MQRSLLGTIIPFIVLVKIAAAQEPAPSVVSKVTLSQGQGHLARVELARIDAPVALSVYSDVADEVLGSLRLPAGYRAVTLPGKQPAIVRSTDSLFHEALRLAQGRRVQVTVTQNGSQRVETGKLVALTPETINLLENDAILQIPFSDLQALTVEADLARRVKSLADSVPVPLQIQIVPDDSPSSELISYIQHIPSWNVHYYLDLAPSIQPRTIQGWVQVTNPTPTDWTNITLVLSGSSSSVQVSSGVSLPSGQTGTFPLFANAPPIEAHIRHSITLPDPSTTDAAEVQARLINNQPGGHQLLAGTLDVSFGPPRPGRGTIQDLPHGDGTAAPKCSPANEAVVSLGKDSSILIHRLADASAGRAETIDGVTLMERPLRTVNYTIENRGRHRRSVMVSLPRQAGWLGAQEQVDVEPVQSCHRSIVVGAAEPIAHDLREITTADLDRILRNTPPGSTAKLLGEVRQFKLRLDSLQNKVDKLTAVIINLEQRRQYLARTGADAIVRNDATVAERLRQQQDDLLRKQAKLRSQLDELLVPASAY